MTRLRFIAIPVKELEDRAHEAKARAVPHRLSCTAERDAASCARSSRSLIDGSMERVVLAQLPDAILNCPNAHELTTRATCGDPPPEADFDWATDSSTVTPAEIATFIQRPRRKFELTPLDAENPTQLVHDSPRTCARGLPFTLERSHTFARASEEARLHLERCRRELTEPNDCTDDDDALYHCASSTQMIMQVLKRSAASDKRERTIRCEMSSLELLSVPGSESNYGTMCEQKRAFWHALSKSRRDASSLTKLEEQLNAERMLSVDDATAAAFALECAPFQYAHEPANGADVDTTAAIAKLLRGTSRRGIANVRTPAGTAHVKPRAQAMTLTASYRTACISTQPGADAAKGRSAYPPMPPCVVRRAIPPPQPQNGRGVTGLSKADYTHNLQECAGANPSTTLATRLSCNVDVDTSRSAAAASSPRYYPLYAVAQANASVWQRKPTSKLSIDLNCLSPMPSSSLHPSCLFPSACMLPVRKKLLAEAQLGNMAAMDRILPPQLRVPLGLLRCAHTKRTSAVLQAESESHSQPESTVHVAKRVKTLRVSAASACYEAVPACDTTSASEADATLASAAVAATPPQRKPSADCATAISSAAQGQRPQRLLRRPLPPNGSSMAHMLDSYIEQRHGQPEQQQQQREEHRRHHHHHQQQQQEQQSQHQQQERKQQQQQQQKQRRKWMPEMDNDIARSAQSKRQRLAGECVTTDAPVHAAIVRQPTLITHEADEDEPGAAKRDANLAAQHTANMHVPTRVFSSETMLEHVSLLQALENDRCVTIIERDMPAPLSFVFDERVGMCLASVDTVLGSEQGMRAFAKQLMQQAQRFEKLWVLLDCSSSDHGTTMTAVHRQRLPAFAASLLFASAEQNVWVPLAYGFSQAHVAQLVRSAIDGAARNAELLQGVARQAQHIWYDRAFLLQNETRHECFLAAFPSLNSFSAQRILDGTTMRKFLSMSLERKLAKFPTVPAAMLQAAHRLAIEPMRQDTVPRTQDTALVQPRQQACVQPHSWQQVPPEPRQQACVQPHSWQQVPPEPRQQACVQPHSWQQAPPEPGQQACVQPHSWQQVPPEPHLNSYPTQAEDSVLHCDNITALSQASTIFSEPPDAEPEWMQKARTRRLQLSMSPTSTQTRLTWANVTQTHQQ